MKKTIITAACVASTVLLVSSVPAGTLIIRDLAGPGEDCAVPLVANSDVDQDAAGNVSVTPDTPLPSCLGTGQGGALNVAVSAVPAGPVDPNDTVNVTWQVTNFIPGVTTCDPTGGTGSWAADVNASVAAANSSSASSINETETYTMTSTATFSLECNNGSDTDSQQIVVNGGGGGGQMGWDFEAPAGCPAFNPTPDGLEPDFPPVRFFIPSGTIQPQFAAIFNAEFPGNFGIQREFRIARGKYVAVSFTAPNPFPGDGNGKFDWTSPGSGGVDNIVIASISQCPGDFTTGAGTGCLKQSSPLSWRNGSTTALLCGLVPGQRYFLNVAHATIASPGTPECRHANGNPASECDWLVQTTD